MTGVAVFYTPDPATQAGDEGCPRVYDVTPEQARDMSADHLVMWTATDERFSYGLRVPSPETRFFWQRTEVVNPWAFFKPLAPYPVRDRSADRHDAAGREGSEPALLREASPDAARLFDAFD